MKKDATQRATTEIANSWSAHSTINHVRSPDTSPLVRAAAGAAPRRGPAGFPAHFASL